MRIEEARCIAAHVDLAIVNNVKFEKSDAEFRFLNA